MTAYLLDTHVWALDLKLDDQLPKRMLDVIDGADGAYVSVISVYEIAQKVRLRKWPEMEPFANNLARALAEQAINWRI